MKTIAAFLISLALAGCATHTAKDVSNAFQQGWKSGWHAAHEGYEI